MGVRAFVMWFGNACESLSACICALSERGIVYVPLDASVQTQVAALECHLCRYHTYPLLPAHAQCVVLRLKLSCVGMWGSPLLVHS